MPPPHSTPACLEASPLPLRSEACFLFRCRPCSLAQKHVGLSPGVRRVDPASSELRAT